MSSLYLIAQIDGVKVAIKSDVVDSVIRVQDVVPVPKSSPIVAGLFALRSRVLTLIDSQYQVTGTPKPAQDGTYAIVANIGGFQFGLLVESVESVVSIDENQFEQNLKPAASWLEITQTLANVDGKLVTIIDPERLLSISQSLAA
jgi:purine-binding chemotaxis protein CheW